MRTLKNLFLLVLLSISLILTIKAQPDIVCTLTYNPFEIKELGYTDGFGWSYGYSSPLFEKRINSNLIFIGKVVAQETSRPYEIEGFNETYFQTTEVKILNPIAGKLDTKSIKLSVRTFCGDTIGKVEIGKEYIFFANLIETESFQGVVSLKWSAAINNIPQNERNKIINKIESARSSIKQPVDGYIIEHRSNFYRDFVNKSFNEGLVWRDPKFIGNWQIMKLGYDPEYAKPLEGIKVFAQLRSGKDKYMTETDSEGRFEFKNLPNGDFIIEPDLPKTYLVIGKCYLNEKALNLVGLTVNERGDSCNRTIRFDVQPAGRIEAEIFLKKGSWKDYSKPNIYLVGANSKTGEVYESYLLSIPSSQFRYESEFSNENKTDVITDKKLTFTINKVMTGEYILRINTSAGGDIYYPGTQFPQKAKVFMVKESETAKITFYVESLRD